MFNFLFLISAIILVSIDFVYINVMKGYFTPFYISNADFQQAT